MEPRRQFRTTAKHGIPFLAMMAGICILGLFEVMEAEAQQLAVAPMKLSLKGSPGKRVSTRLQVQNLGQPELCVFFSIKTIDLAQSEDGQWSPVLPDDPMDLMGKASCRSWISLQEGDEDVHRVESMDTEYLNIGVHIPSDARGFFFAAIVITVMPSASGIATMPGVTTRYEFIVPVLVEIERPALAPCVRLVDASLEAVESGQVKSSLVTLGIENQGRTLSYLVASAEIRTCDGDGADMGVQKVRFEEVGIIPGSRLNLKASLPNPLLPGRYRVIGNLSVDGQPVERFQKDVDTGRTTDKGFKSPDGRTPSMMKAKAMEVDPNPIGPARIVSTVQILSHEPTAVLVDRKGSFGVFQDTLSEDSRRTYLGDKTIEMHTNFPAHLQVSAAAMSAAGGNWRAEAAPVKVLEGTKVIFSVKATEVKIERLTGGSSGVKVAEVLVRIIPAVL